MIVKIPFNESHSNYDGVWRYQLDWGDNVAGTGNSVNPPVNDTTIDVTHAYQENGTYTLSLLLEDMDSSIYTADFTIDIDNNPIRFANFLLNGGSFSDNNPVDEDAITFLQRGETTITDPVFLRIDTQGTLTLFLDESNALRFRTPKEMFNSSNDPDFKMFLQVLKLLLNNYQDKISDMYAAEPSLASMPHFSVKIEDIPQELYPLMLKLIKYGDENYKMKWPKGFSVKLTDKAILDLLKNYKLYISENFYF